jgi:hypothetical protein
MSQAQKSECRRSRKSSTAYKGVTLWNNRVMLKPEVTRHPGFWTGYYSTFSPDHPVGSRQHIRRIIPILDIRLQIHRITRSARARTFGGTTAISIWILDFRFSMMVIESLGRLWPGLGEARLNRFASRFSG